MADNLRDVLLAIREKRGTLTPEVVVEEASDPQHPLHHRFEWNDQEAARRFRLAQAGELLRVTYSDKSDPQNPRNLRAFWVTRGVEGRPKSEYTPTEEVLADPIQRQLMLNAMRREWTNFQQRYSNMAEFAVLLDTWRQEQAG